MTFLHTADLHLGRTLHDRSLIEDQRAVLSQLLAALEAHNPAALLVSGDVYDRSIPSPEAVSLLGEFLGAARKRFPDLLIVVIAGNHDSPERLSYGDELFASLGIRIVADPERAFQPIIVEQGGERCALFALPFLSPGSLRVPGENGEPVPLRSQRDLAAEAATRLERARREAEAAGATSTVLAAHLFAAGGAESESERVFLGTAERVDAALFAGFDYVALGHLHRFQRISDNAWYSGSPLAYSFDEADRRHCFLRVGVGPHGEQRPGERTRPAVAPIPVRPLRKVTRLSGTFDSFMEDGAHAGERDDYLEINLTDGHLTENPLTVLRVRYPNLLSVRQDAALAATGAGSSAAPAPRAADRRNVSDDFEDFLADLYGETDEAKAALFKAMAEEVADETA